MPAYIYSDKVNKYVLSGKYGGKVNCSYKFENPVNQDIDYLTGEVILFYFNQ